MGLTHACLSRTRPRPCQEAPRPRRAASLVDAHNGEVTSFKTSESTRSANTPARASGDARCGLTSCPMVPSSLPVGRSPLSTWAETRTCAIPIGTPARVGRSHLAACLEACSPVCSQTYVPANTPLSLGCPRLSPPSAALCHERRQAHTGRRPEVAIGCAERLPRTIGARGFCERRWATSAS